MSDASALAVAAYVGLGSNLDHPPRRIHNALRALTRLPTSRITAVSSLYLGPPLGPADQPDYYNAAAALETELEPHELLVALQGIEQAAGRLANPRRWGPRPIDLDLLLYGAETITAPALRVPHPGLTQRGFVLYPLVEIEPNLRLPTGESLKDLVADLADTAPRRVAALQVPQS